MPSNVEALTRRPDQAVLRPGTGRPLDGQRPGLTVVAGGTEPRFGVGGDGGAPVREALKTTGNEQSRGPVGPPGSGFTRKDSVGVGSRQPEAEFVGPGIETKAGHQPEAVIVDLQAARAKRSGAAPEEQSGQRAA